MLVKLGIPAPVVNLAVSVALASCLLYGFVSMPADLEDADVLFWQYAKGKVVTGVSSFGGYFGMGHPASLYRKLKSNLDDPIATNFTEHLGINVTDDTLSGVGVRLYIPQNQIRSGPAVIFFHGGLWISGSLDNHDHIAAHFAKKLGVVIVSVDYRLAPEHPYPAPLDDCFHVTHHILSQAERFNLDPNNIALVGVGAGATLAAAVALRLRDTAPDLPSPSIQILVNPLLQAVDFSTPSYYQNQYDAAFPKYLGVNCWLWYAVGWEGHRKYAQHAVTNYHTSAAFKQSKTAALVNHNLLHRKLVHESYRPNRVDFGTDHIWDDLKDVLADPYFAPLMASDVRRLPKSYILASQYDIVRDDAMIYAKRLEKAGVPVTVEYYERAVHDMLIMKNKVSLGSTMLKDITHYLLRNL